MSCATPRTKRYGPRYGYMAKIGELPELRPVHSAVAFCLLEGMDNSEMCGAIGISTPTLERHMQTLRVHYGAANTRRLIVKLCREEFAR